MNRACNRSVRLWRVGEHIAERFSQDPRIRIGSFPLRAQEVNGGTRLLVTFNAETYSLADVQLSLAEWNRDDVIDFVMSPYPSHGTRTGFYTDDLEELSFKSPEEVRRGAMIRSDLRGAKLMGVDFYLIDLRETQLTPDQRRQVVATGGIVE
jgi:hypothetical protein